MKTFDAAFEQRTSAPPPEVDGPLKERWNHSLGSITELPPLNLSNAAQERHRIYCLLLMALVESYWNPLKRGRDGRYPWNEPPGPDGGPYLDPDYLGHNIAAIAVDGVGHVLDFEFNHNKIFDSSTEHAEARLVRRVYSLARLSDSWSPSPVSGQGGNATQPTYADLADVTIYTSLESCSQCAGVMALARVKEVVYLQTDPGMFWIGRILRNLTTDKLRAPLPIAASEIGLGHFADLDQRFGAFKRALGPQKPFFEPLADTDDAKLDVTPSVTSFLCTADARRTFRQGRDDFHALAGGGLVDPDHRPEEHPLALTNAGAIAEAADFLRYAVQKGRRATPHGT